MRTAWHAAKKEVVRASTLNGREKDGRSVAIAWADKEKTRCICFYTGVEFEKEAGIILGPVLPQSPDSYLCAPGSELARRNEVDLFQNTVEMNCNTCAKLERISYKKDMSGLMPGRCSVMSADHPYYRGDHFLFAPDDCMGMMCHTPRMKP